MMKFRSLTAQHSRPATSFLFWLDDLAAADHADITADRDAGHRLDGSHDARPDLAGPPDEAPLRQVHLGLWLCEAIADEIGRSGTGGAAGRHILDKAAVVPRPPLA